MATAIEREQVAAIRARVTSARKDWRLHRKICRVCAQLSKDRSQYCEQGWDLRVELHYAERALGDYRKPTPIQQDPLF